MYEDHLYVEGSVALNITFSFLFFFSGKSVCFIYNHNLLTELLVLQLIQNDYPRTKYYSKQSTIPENISTMKKLKFYIRLVLPTLSLLLCTPLHPSTDTLGPTLTCSSLEEELWCNMNVSCLPLGRLMKGFSSYLTILFTFFFFSNML